MRSTMSATPDGSSSVSHPLYNTPLVPLPTVSSSSPSLPISNTTTPTATCSTSLPSSSTPQSLVHFHHHSSSAPSPAPPIHSNSAPNTVPSSNKTISPPATATSTNISDPSNSAAMLHHQSHCHHSQTLHHQQQQLPPDHDHNYDPSQDILKHQRKQHTSPSKYSTSALPQPPTSSSSFDRPHDPSPPVPSLLSPSSSQRQKQIHQSPSHPQQLTQHSQHLNQSPNPSQRNQHHHSLRQSPTPSLPRRQTSQPSPSSQLLHHHQSQSQPPPPHSQHHPPQPPPSHQHPYPTINSIPSVHPVGDIPNVHAIPNTSAIQSFSTLPAIDSIAPILPPPSSATDATNHLLTPNHVSAHFSTPLLSGAVDKRRKLRKPTRSSPLATYPSPANDTGPVLTPSHHANPMSSFHPGQTHAPHIAPVPSVSTPSSYQIPNPHLLHHPPPQLQHSDVQHQQPPHSYPLHYTSLPTHPQPNIHPNQHVHTHAHASLPPPSHHPHHQLNLHQQTSPDILSNAAPIMPPPPPPRPVYEADGIQFKVLEQLPDLKIQRLRSEKIKPIESLTFSDIKAYNRNQLRAYCSVYGIRRKKKADMERDMARYAALFHPNDTNYDLSKFQPTEYADGPIPRRKVPVTKEQKEKAAGNFKQLTNALHQRPALSSTTHVTGHPLYSASLSHVSSTVPSPQQAQLQLQQHRGLVDGIHNNINNGSSGGGLTDVTHGLIGNNVVGVGPNTHGHPHQQLSHGHFAHPQQQQQPNAAEAAAEAAAAVVAAQSIHPYNIPASLITGAGLHNVHRSSPAVAIGVPAGVPLQAEISGRMQQTRGTVRRTQGILQAGQIIETQQQRSREHSHVTQEESGSKIHAQEQDDESAENNVKGCGGRRETHMEIGKIDNAVAVNAKNENEEDEDENQEGCGGVSGEGDAEQVENQDVLRKVEESTHNDEDHERLDEEEGHQLSSGTYGQSHVSSQGMEGREDDLHDEESEVGNTGVSASDLMSVAEIHVPHQLF